MSTPNPMPTPTRDDIPNDDVLVGAAAVDILSQLLRSFLCDVSPSFVIL